MKEYIYNVSIYCTPIRKRVRVVKRKKQKEKVFVSVTQKGWRSTTFSGFGNGISCVLKAIRKSS